MADELDAASLFFMEAFLPENRADPYDLYRRMRQSGPLLATDLEMHLAFGHEACWGIVRHPSASSDERHGRVFRREALTNPRLAAEFDKPVSLVFMDPPDHDRLRALVAKQFTPRRVELLQHEMATITNELLTDLSDRANDGEQVDVVEALAYPLPIAVICQMLGIPAADHHSFRVWSAALARSVDPGVLRTEVDNQAIDDANDALSDYTSALLIERRQTPGDDLLSALAMIGNDDAITDAELINLVALLLVAGHETTVNLIGNGIVALLDHPDQLADLRAHPDIAPNAIDELLRYDTPLQMVQRIALQDIDIGGVTIPAGDQVIAMLAAANRDPAVFEHPDRLELRRHNANRNMSFGGGIHHCLGAALARTEGVVAITAFLHRFDHIELAEPPTIRSSFNLRGRDRIAVELRH